MLIRGLIALAFGTLGLGISEYVAMGLLPYWAQSFDVSIAESGHAISAYALGVAIGAFTIILMRKMKLKNILILLIILHIVGNVLTAFAPTFETMLGARFIAGLPHGSYFGVGSIIAQRLAAKGKGTSAVAIMVAGMTIANIFGVPLGTALAHALSWRMIFYIVVLWGVLVLVSAIMWIRDVGKIQDTGFMGQFAFLKHPAPWLVLGATMFGNAGIFCMHSYISPLLTDFAGIPLEMVSAVLVAMGISMVIFNLVSGRLCDRFTPGLVATVCQFVAIGVLLGIAFLGTNPIFCIVFAVIAAGMLFAISSPEQVSILRVAPGGLLLGASMVQAAFNLGNAMGAYVGGIPFTFHMSLSYVTIFGAVLAAIGAFALLRYYRKYESTFPDPTEESTSTQQDGVAQGASVAMETNEFGMSDELMAQYHAQKAADYAAKAAAAATKNAIQEAVAANPLGLNAAAYDEANAPAKQAAQSDTQPVEPVAKAAPAAPATAENAKAVETAPAAESAKPAEDKAAAAK